MKASPLLTTCLTWVAWSALAPALAAPAEAGAGTLSVARPPKSAKADFERQVMPALRLNCLPCHNKTTSKADLVLESPLDMLKGGETGPALVPGKASASLLFKLAAHLDKPRMPPRGNKANAVDLTPEQLGWLAQWIDQGAKASPKREEVVAWEPLPDSVRPILALAVAANGRYVAWGHGNRLEVSRLVDGAPLASPSDPALASPRGAPAAHRDEVNAVALSADGQWLASGGFRQVTLWRREFEWRPLKTGGARAAAAAVREAPTAAPLILVEGVAVCLKTNSPTSAVGLVRDLDAEEAAAAAARLQARCKAQRTFRDESLTAARKEADAQRDRLKKASSAVDAAQKPVTEREAALAKLRLGRAEAETKLAATTNGPAEPKKAAADRLKEAVQAVEKAEGELKPLLAKLEAARNELDLAGQAVNRTEAAVVSAQAALDAAGAALNESEVSARTARARAAAGPPPVAAAACDPADGWAITAHSDRTLRIWNLTNGAPLDTIPLPFAARALGAVSGGRIVVIGDQGRQSEVSLLPSWRLAARLGSETGPSPFPDRITALAFRPDGGLLAVGGGEPSRRGDVTFWNPATGLPVATNLAALHSDTVLSLAFSPDGRWLASGGADRFARLVDVAAGRQLRAFEGHTGHVLAVAWSADQRTLVTAGADLSVKLWDPVSGEKRKQGSGFSREVTALSCVGDGPRFAAASGEGEIRILNDAVDKVGQFTGPKDFTYALGVSADGEWLAAGGQEGVLRVWRKGREAPAWERGPTPAAGGRDKLASQARP